MSRVLFALCLNSGSSGGSALVDMLVFGRPEDVVYLHRFVFYQEEKPAFRRVVVILDLLVVVCGGFRVRSTDIVDVVVECA